MEIKLAKTNIRKQVGGNLLTNILSLGRAFAPSLAKTVGLSALAGAASEGASQIVKKISGKGQVGGFLIPQYKVNQLIQYKDWLTDAQKKSRWYQHYKQVDKLLLNRLKHSQAAFWVLYLDQLVSH